MKTTLLIAVILATPFAHAHIGLEQTSATAGAYQKLTFKVGHGCEGSATNAITVLLPEAVTGAKPMPKSGWTITSAVREVSWKGGPLADAQYDEFSMQVKLPDAAGKYYFKVTQVCDKGRAEWSELPAAPGAKMKFPAPVLDVVPAAASAHQH